MSRAFSDVQDALGVGRDAHRGGQPGETGPNVIARGQAWVGAEQRDGADAAVGGGDHERTVGQGVDELRAVEGGGVAPVVGGAGGTGPRDGGDRAGGGDAADAVVTRIGDVERLVRGVVVDAGGLVEAGDGGRAVHVPRAAPAHPGHELLLDGPVDAVVGDPDGVGSAVWTERNAAQAGRAVGLGDADLLTDAEGCRRAHFQVAEDHAQVVPPDRARVTVRQADAQHPGATVARLVDQGRGLEGDGRAGEDGAVGGVAIERGDLDLTRLDIDVEACGAVLTRVGAAGRRGQGGGGAASAAASQEQGGQHGGDVSAQVCESKHRALLGPEMGLERGYSGRCHLR